MSELKNIIDNETKKFLEYVDKLATLELNFRAYISEKGLSEESYKIAAEEYHNEIVTIKENVIATENVISEITENTNFVDEDTLTKLNTGLGRIWRIIIANETFCNEYGGVSFTDEPAENLYKEIYDKHLVELKEFMYDFIRVSNRLFSR